MTSSFTFTACVADEAMSKVSRLFNASLDDILNELLQNARRSGARVIRVDQRNDPDRGPVICVADDGPGLADPRSLFTLGRSAWEAQVVEGEDAAGMGFFALAGRGAQIVAQQRGTDQSWQIEATPESFAGDSPIAVSAGPVGHRGTAITFPQIDKENVAAAVQHAARYFPLPVFLNGEEMERTDFLAEAAHIEEWNGLRIGVFHMLTRRALFQGHNINFHGITLWATLPELHQQFHKSFYARVDVTHCAALKLVLPARKELVQDAFYDRLGMAIRKLFFRLLLEGGTHSLSREDYCLSHALGIKLPEAAPMLRPFAPDQADGNQSPCNAAEVISSDALIFVGSDGPVEEQNLARAIEQRAEALPLYDPNAAFKGYKWYDRLPRVDLIGYRAHIGEEVHEVAVEDGFDLQTRPDRLEVLLERSGPAGTEDWALPTDALIIAENYASLDEADLHVTRDAMLTPAQLVAFMEAALFSPSDDSEAGSYDQQQQWFTDEAEDMAITLLQSSTEADVNLIKRYLRRELLWRFPKDIDLIIRVQGRQIEIEGCRAQAGLNT